MKKIIFLLALFLKAAPLLFAQSPALKPIDSLPEIQIGTQSDIHFLSPEPIQYADLSSHSVIGDLPVKNLLRIRIIPDSLRNLRGDGQNLGVITITGESFIAQYRLVFTNAPLNRIPASVEIQPAQCRPLDFPGISMTSADMRAYALAVLRMGKQSHVRKAKAYGMTAQLNHIYTVGDEVLLDITYKNETELPYTIDELRFKIEDKKITKATNVQSLEIKPEFQLYPLASFKRQFHNVYVLKKATFPDNKVLNVELSEKQVSGRTLTLRIKYQDILHADTF